MPELIDAGAIQFDKLSHDLQLAARHLVGRPVEDNFRLVQENYFVSYLLREAHIVRYHHASELQLKL